MNKTDLIAAVAEAAGLTRANADAAIDAVLGAITQSLKDGNEVRLSGFGTFHVADRAASKGRNPRTGETIEVAACRQAKFSAGKGLKDTVNATSAA